MSFFTPTFKVVLATTHMALREALDSLSITRYRSVLDVLARELARFGWSAPRIALASVNPHAGEGGLFGTEDDAILAPAASQARDRGLDVVGPLPADSLYARAHAGEFDVVVAPYHDQGLAPVKVIAPRSAANVTLGLPFVQTSPDHGTAYGIAGQGVADSGGMETAMEWAVELVERQAGRQPGRQEPRQDRQTP
jgi:4-hydroxythreonine-4-phosphate dehydrogenase